VRGVPEPDVTVSCDIATFIAMGTGRDDAVTALQEGRLHFSGDPEKATLIAMARAGAKT
jgi:putative sterol carrier protein